MTIQPMGGDVGKEVGALTDTKKKELLGQAAVASDSPVEAGLGPEAEVAQEQLVPGDDGEENKDASNDASKKEAAAKGASSDVAAKKGADVVKPANSAPAAVSSSGGSSSGQPPSGPVPPGSGLSGGTPPVPDKNADNEGSVALKTLTGLDAIPVKGFSTRKWDMINIKRQKYRVSLSNNTLGYNINANLVNILHSGSFNGMMTAFVESHVINLWTLIKQTAIKIPTVESLIKASFKEAKYVSSEVTETFKNKEKELTKTSTTPGVSFSSMAYKSVIGDVTNQIKILDRLSTFSRSHLTLFFLLNCLEFIYLFVQQPGVSLLKLSTDELSVLKKAIIVKELNSNGTFDDNNLDAGSQKFVKEQTLVVDGANQRPIIGLVLLSKMTYLPIIPCSNISKINYSVLKMFGFSFGKQTERGTSLIFTNEKVSVESTIANFTVDDFMSISLIQEMRDALLLHSNSALEMASAYELFMSLGVFTHCGSNNFDLLELPGIKLGSWFGAVVFDKVVSTDTSFYNGVFEVEEILVRMDIIARSYFNVVGDVVRSGYNANISYQRYTLPSVVADRQKILNKATSVFVKSSKLNDLSLLLKENNSKFILKTIFPVVNDIMRSSYVVKPLPYMGDSILGWSLAGLMNQNEVIDDSLSYHALSGKEIIPVIDDGKYYIGSCHALTILSSYFLNSERRLNQVIRTTPFVSLQPRKYLYLMDNTVSDLDIEIGSKGKNYRIELQSISFTSELPDSSIIEHVPSKYEILYGSCVEDGVYTIVGDVSKVPADDFARWEKAKGSDFSIPGRIISEGSGMAQPDLVVPESGDGQQTPSENSGVAGNFFSMSFEELRSAIREFNAGRINASESLKFVRERHDIIEQFIVCFPAVANNTADTRLKAYKLRLVVFENAILRGTKVPRSKRDQPGSSGEAGGTATDTDWDGD